MDDELRALGHAARAEVEADIDVDEAWATISTGPTRMEPSAVSTASRPPRGWIAAAAAIVVLAGGAFLLTDRGGDTIQSAEEPTIGGTLPSAAPATSTTSTTMAADAPAAADTTVPVDPVPVTAITPPPVPDDSTAPETTTATMSTTSTTISSTAPGTPAATAWREFTWEGSRIRRSCQADGRCTQVRIGPDGAAISLEPSSRRLIRHSVPPVSALVPAEFGDVWFELVGPDGVIYLGVDPLVPDADGLAADLVALTLTEGDADREIGRWSGVTDRIGDHDLAPTRDGIVIVGCCGPDTVRPAPTAEIAVGWIDRNGVSVTSDAPSLHVEHIDGGYAFVRDGLKWAVESEAGGRGMPPIVPTFDGGLVAVLYGFDGTTTVVRGWHDGLVEQVRLDTAAEQIVAVDRSGVALVENGERFARVGLFDDRGDYWTGGREIDIGGTGELVLPGLNEAIAAEQPGWSFEPLMFGHAVSGPTAVNETRRVEAAPTSDTTWTVTATTDGFFDDSVYASRFELELRRAEDGTLRFERGRWSQACNADRGYQDFTPDLCS